MRRPRPSSIIQSNDDVPSPRIEANANTIKKESIDCGITALRCCNTATCRKLGTTKLFLTLIILTGIVQGAIQRYFVLSAKQATSEFRYDRFVIDWLLVTDGICMGLFAILVSYWGNRIHRISWLAGLLIFQSIVSLSVIIPTLAHNNDDGHTTIAAYRQNTLCITRMAENLMDEAPHSVTTLVLLFILQLSIGLGGIAFYTLGLSYMDDNVLEHFSPAFFGAALGAKYWGNQWGSALVYGVAETSLGWWLGWTVLSPLLFILAIIIALFPKRMLSTVVRWAADNIVEEATSGSQLSISPHRLLADIGFLSSLRRMITNKILMFNAIATCLIATAMLNYYFHEPSYLQSRFLMPAENIGGVRNEWTSKLLTAMLKPPLIALVILTASLIIAKANPSARKLAAWNIIASGVAVIIFVASIFITCNHNSMAGAYNGKLTHPYCSRNCICSDLIRFQPVCPQDSVLTYYSPCHAGCAGEYYANGQRIFTNCTCGVDTEIPMKNILATEGACGYETCQKMWILHQILSIIVWTFLGSALVSRVLITLRSVLPQDKSLALAVELTLIGIIAFIPGKVAYQMIADYSCEFVSQNSELCYLHDSNTFGNILNITSAVLIGIAIIFYVFIFIYVKDLPLYGADADDGGGYRPIPMQPIIGTQTMNIQPQQTTNEDVQQLQQTTMNPAQFVYNPNPMLQRAFSPTEQSDRHSSLNSSALPDSPAEQLDFNPQNNLVYADIQRNPANANRHYLESEVL